MGMFQVMKAIWGLKKRERLTRAQMLAYQEAELRSLVRHTWRRSSFYREYYSDHGLKETDLGDITVRDLPFTDKELLMEHFDRVVTDSRLRKKSLQAFITTPMDRQMKYLGRYVVIHTSGSSGNIGIFVHDMMSWAMYQAGYPARVMNADRFALHRNQVAACINLNGRYAGVTISRFQPRILTRLLLLPVQDPIPRNVEALNHFQPELLGGYSSTIAALACEAMAGRLNITPRMVGTSAEKLTDRMRSDIEQAWPGRQINFYGSSECPLVAVQRHGGSVYTIYDDISILELLDEQDEPVAEGQAGCVVLTNLHNRAMPVIRYQMLDMAERGPDQADSPFSTFASIHGRVDDALPIVLDDGEHGTLSPLVLYGFVVPGLQKAKFILTGRDRIEVRYASDSDIDRLVSNQFRNVLAASSAAKAMRVDVERVRELPPDSRTGKFHITEIRPH
jgi:phenylacetate-coenzyme A ligase PaaK-like adenylate-forming protein